MKLKPLINQVGRYHFDGAVIYELSFAYTVLVSLLLTATFTDYLPGNVLHRLLFLGLVPVIFKIFCIDQMDRQWLLIQVCGLGLLLIVWRLSHDFTMVPMGLFILGARGIDFRRVIRLYLMVGLVFLIVTMGASLAGVIKNLIYYRTRGGADLVRQSFGVIYPTDFAAHLLFLLLAYFYLRFRNLRWWDYGIVVLVIMMVMYLNDARLAAGSLMIMIPTFWIARRASKGGRLARLMAAFYWGLPVLAAYLINALSFFYSDSNRWMGKVDSLLSGRLTLGHRAFDQYGFSWLGQKVTEHGWGGSKGATASNYFYIDSSFVRAPIIYGIVMAIVLLMIMVVISWRSIQSGSYALAAVIVIVTISAVVEQRLIDLAYDPFLIALLATTSTQVQSNKEKSYENKLHG